MAGTEDLIAAARAWAAADPDPITAAAVREVVRRADPDELQSLFGGRVRFGTAGLRAPLGAGPMRMNRLVIRQSAAGVARHLLASQPDAAERGVVVAHDARHGSEDFAREAVAVLRSLGLAVHAFDGPAPTPLAAFALAHLGAVAALVVTASHNPAADNGLKVYAADGAQIAPPVDREIAAAIQAVAEEPWAPPTVPPGPLHDLGPAHGRTDVVSAYLAMAASVLGGRRPRHPVVLAATSLHGVGADLLSMVLEDNGHAPLHHVASQRDPDPDFPTVAFPNPEEPGALDELIALADAHAAVLGLANDPDADRLALVAPRRDGGWAQLTGDEVGALLAHHLLELSAGRPDRLVVTTVVSSRLTAAMAEHAGVHHAETLTGFKWLSRPAMQHPNWYQVLAYEEALGYAVGPTARDKDGITAALVAADLASSLAAEGRDVWDVLDLLARRHGAHVQANASLRQVVPGAVERTFDAPPKVIGGVEVLGSDRPADDVLLLELADRTRVALRPSGTEAKLKYYCEAIEPVAPDEEPDAARARARARLAAVTADLTRSLS